MIDSSSTGMMKCLRVFIVSVSILLPFCTEAQQTRMDSLLVVLKEAKSDSSKSDIYHALSIAAYSSNYKKSLEYAQEAAYLAKKTGNHRLLANAYKSIASVFVSIGILDQAVFYFNLSADEAAKAGDKAEQLKNQLNLGLVYIGLGDFKKALSIYKQSDSLLNKVYAFVGETLPVADAITIQLNVGLCYAAMGNFSTAYAYFDKGLALAIAKANQPMLTARLFLAKANTHLKEDNLSESFTALKQAELILEKLQEKPLLIGTQSLLATIEERKSNFDKAVKMYSRLYQEAMQVGSLKMMKEFSHSLYRNYERIQQSDSAIKYLNLFNKYEKDAKGQEAKEALLRKELMQDFSAREKILVEKQAVLSRRMAYFVLVGTGLFMVLLWWVFFYKKRYRLASLQKFKMQLETERLELEQKQLQAQVSDKEKQLSDLAYQLSKNAMLEKLVAELQAMDHRGKDRQIAEAQNGEGATANHQANIWDEFEIRFVKTHAGFFDRLMTAYPGLTVNERRLCAFLRLDMTTKEISVITGQSIRAIEIARTRLRKKLQLTETEKTLFEHLSLF